MSSASSGGSPCRRRKAKIGRQYMRQSFSSASCAAGDSPCASSTTLQCVVVNAAPLCCSVAAEPIGVSEVASSSAGTLRSKEKVATKSSLHPLTTNANKAASSPTPFQFELIRPIGHGHHGPQDTLPTMVYVAAGCPLSRWPLTKVWSTRRVERSRFWVSGVSPVNVLPFTAPSRSPGAGLPTADFGTISVIVPSALKLLPGKRPMGVSVGTPITRPTTAVWIVPYSKVVFPLPSVLMPT